MKLKGLLLFIVMALLLISFTACDSKKNKKANTENNKSESNLKIYYMNSDISVQNALAKFRGKYKNVNIDDNIFHNAEEYKTKVTMDILAGEGPDVIFLRPKWFESVNKFSSSGVLCDLNEFIKKDKDFNMSDYNENVLNSFEQDGKRLTIPLAFNFNIFTTSKETLQRNNIKIDLSNWNYNGLLQVVREFQEENKGKNKYFFSNDFSISNLIKGSGISFVDFKNKKSMFNSKDFIEMLEMYKELYPSICTDEAVKDIPTNKCLEDGIYIMKASSKTSPRALSSDYSLYKSVGEEMEIYPFPTLKGEKSSPVAYQEESVGINSQSENKGTAYEFIKILMSKDLQIEYSLKNILMGISVNKYAYEEDLKYYMSKEFGDGSGLMYEESGTYEVKSVPLPETIKTQLENIISRVSKCEIEDAEILNIAKEALPDFLSGRKTAAQTAKEIDGKVNLYLNE